MAGDLRDPRRAALPVAAAVGGMAVPAALYALINAGGDGLRGWAIPTATDIAFALAVLAVISTHLPGGLRTFLLTLAVVDDLLAITVIAVFYTEELHLPWLLLALVPLGAFGAAVQRGMRSRLAAAAAGGGHVGAGARLRRARDGGRACCSPSPSPSGAAADGPDAAGPRRAPRAPLPPPVGGGRRAGVRLHRRGRAVGGLAGLGAALQDRIALGIVVGLVVGKAVGITGADLAGRPVHPRPARRGARLARRRRALRARRHRVHRVAAHRRARLRRGIGAGASTRRSASSWAPLARRADRRGVLRLRNRRYRRMCAEEEQRRRPRRRSGRLRAGFRRGLNECRCRPRLPDVPSGYTRKEVVRTLHAHRTREVAVR